MGLARTIFGLTMLLVSGSVRAAPISDVAAWTSSFAKAALANDPDAMLARVREVAHPRFNTDTLRGIFDKIDSVVGTKPGDHAELFDERNVGTFYKRINVAVHYEKTFMFYSVTFLHEDAGWQMVEFDYNTNLNETLDLKWLE